MVPFHGTSIPTCLIDSKPHAAVRPICEILGLAWGSQFERSKRDAVLRSTVRVTRTVAEDGKLRKMILLPLDMLNGWLFTINDRRIRNAQAREAVLLYKKECYQALFHYWQSKNANTAPAQKNLALTTDVTPLIQTITDAINQQMILMSRVDLANLWNRVDAAMHLLNEAINLLKIADATRQELEEKYHTQFLIGTNH
ncbi:phage antirepressor N-terminal domain-containing protein [Candidiatus Paracoxiella cheracis]|uniref:phage antirepressor N-terminal domain-containing protein n=1 Tax=Candidiatus Paracoxiella cheracis TaxID=3405120 RepID=UPI003BF47D7A